MDLDGKTVIVTGGGSGIGRAVAVACAKAGARVACCGRRDAPLQETAQLVRDIGGQALPVVADITAPEQVSQLVDAVLSRFGTIDVLVNNAGSFRAVGPLWETDPVLWWGDVEVNLRGTALCIRAVLPHMMARDSGVIVNLDGGGGAGGPNVGASAYGSSKAAVARLTESLARELDAVRSSVVVLGFFPGFVRTAMTEGLVTADAGPHWQSFVGDLLATAAPDDADVAAQALLRYVEVAGPALSGGVYDVATAAGHVAEHAARVRDDQLYVMRLRTLPEST